MAFKSKCQVALFHPRFSDAIFDARLLEMQRWCDKFVGRYNQDWYIGYDGYDGSMNVIYFYFIDKSKGNLFALKWL